MTIFKKSDLKKEGKTAKKSMKNRTFFKSAIWEAFWKDFGGVLGGQNPRFFVIFSIKNASKKWDGLEKAKKSHFGAKKANCGLRPADCAGPGEGTKGWGLIGHRLSMSDRQCQASVWRMKGLMNEKKTEDLSPTRKPALREASDVLRTDRRTRK